MVYNQVIHFKNAILLILCFAGVSAFAQNIYPIQLQWNNSKFFYAGNDIQTFQYKAFYFEDAYINHPTNWLPQYTFRTQIPYDANQIDKISIQSTAGFQAEMSSFTGFRGLDSIPSEYSIKAEIQTEQNRKYIMISVIPMRLTTGSNIEFLTEGNIVLQFSSSPTKKATHKTRASSILANGSWYKIGIKETGVHKITFEQLRKIGFATPENCKFYGNSSGMLSTNNADEMPDDLLELPVQKTTDGFLFFARSPNTWYYNQLTQEYEHKVHHYSHLSYIFITSISVPNNYFPTRLAANNRQEYTISQQTDFLIFHEKDEINLLASGSTWYGEKLNAGNSLQIDFKELKPIPGTDLKVKFRAAVRAFSASSVQVSVGSAVRSISYFPIIDDYASEYARDGSTSLSTKSDGNSVSVNIQFMASLPSSECYIDYVSAYGRVFNSFAGKQYILRDAYRTDSTRIRISSAQQLQVWDVTDIPVEMTLTTETDGYSFVTDGLKKREWVVFSENEILSPVLSGVGIGVVENQNLHTQPQAEFLIISHPEFINQAQEIGEWHLAEDNLRYNIATPEQIYNEFSNGIPDAMAIRNYIRMFYNRALAGNGVFPQYVLLLGDGTYNNKTAIAENWKVIPTYQSSNSVSPTQSFVSDDFFGLLDDTEYGITGSLDVGIGRLTAKNKAEADVLVQKIKDYYSAESNGNWQNHLTFIADDEDGNLHMQDADILANKVAGKYPHFNIDKIYLDMYRQVTTSSGERYPDAVLAINNRVQRGSLLVNYTGHGNEYRLAGEKIIDEVGIKNWNNRHRMPVFITATCEFSRFDKHSLVSAGELILLSRNGAGIALFSTTRLVYSSSNMNLNSNFYNFVFENNTTTQSPYRLGDMVRLSKNATGSAGDINKRNFTLLGDPALALKRPQPQVVITHINTKPVENYTDTINALQLVEIKGSISNNTKKSSYVEGTLISTLYDKSIMRTTLANDGGSTMNFKLQNNILFQGNSAVKNGEFNFQFIVPRDIMYNYGQGKFSLYFKPDNNEHTTGYGNFQNFIIGGISDTTLTDTQGPEIQIWLNDKNFIPSGSTNENPVLLAELSDTMGINTSRSAFGHEITLTIDNDTRNSIVLNDYYESAENNFRQGSIKYQIPRLEPGNHTLKIKAWDANNNSSEKNLAFTVKESSKLNISKLLNYPNPFTTQTAFYFEHNKPGQVLQVQIQIYTQSGLAIKSLFSTFTSQGFRSEPIMWDGRDDFGQKIGRGVYFYKIFVKTNENEFAELTEKLVIL